MEKWHGAVVVGHYSGGFFKRFILPDLDKKKVKLELLKVVECIEYLGDEIEFVAWGTGESVAAALAATEEAAEKKCEEKGIVYP